MSERRFAGKKRAAKGSFPASVRALRLLQPAGSRGDTGKHVDRSSISSTEVIKSCFKWDGLTVALATGYTDEQTGHPQTIWTCTCPYNGTFSSVHVWLWLLCVIECVCSLSRCVCVCVPFHFKPQIAESWLDVVSFFFFLKEKIALHCSPCSPKIITDNGSLFITHCIWVNMWFAEAQCHVKS